jgi:hypothetical protein
MNSRELRELSDQLLAEYMQIKQSLEALPDGGTREQWNAAICVQDSANHLFSAAGWLAKHEKVQ